MPLGSLNEMKGATRRQRTGGTAEDERSSCWPDIGDTDCQLPVMKEPVPVDIHSLAGQKIYIVVRCLEIEKQWTRRTADQQRPAAETVTSDLDVVHDSESNRWSCQITLKKRSLAIVYKYWKYTRPRIEPLYQVEATENCLQKIQIVMVQELCLCYIYYIFLFL